jgi:hypothetical protein
MMDLDPNNRKVAAALEKARKLTRKRSTVRLVVFLTVVIVGTTAGQLVREWLILKRADELQQKGELGDAVMAIDAFAPAVFLRGPLAKKRRDLTFKTLFRKAGNARSAGDYEAALETFEKASAFAAQPDKEILADEIQRT